MTLLDFQLIIVITVTLQVGVLNRFSWNSHGWWESTYGWTLCFLWHNQSNRTTDMGENEPQNCFFPFIQPVWDFLRKKFQSLIRYHFSQKRLYSFRHPIIHSLKNSHALQKLFFAVIFVNISAFFWKNCYPKNVQKLIFYKNV